MTCCGNHCRNTIHLASGSYGKFYIQICDINSNKQIKCEIVNPTGQLFSEKVNAPWKDEIPNERRDFYNPNLWLNNPTINNNILSLSQDKSKNVLNISQDVLNISQDVSNISQDVSNISQDVSSISQDVSSISQDVSSISIDVSSIYKDVSSIYKDVSNISKDVLSISKSVFIYILECQSNKYYVGKTINPHNRFKQHFTTDSTAWTSKYKPIRVYQLIPGCDDYDEDKYTLQYMQKYGINNVRGGSFSKINLDINEIQFIEKRINSATNKCYNCGKDGHFAKDCTNNVIDGTGVTKIKTQSVFICKDCNKEFTTLKGIKKHENKDCKTNLSNEINNLQLENKIINNNPLLQIKNKMECCRCGRKSHNINNCYAKTTLNGNKIEELIIK
jgi:cellular nucleic acid-binding protein